MTCCSTRFPLDIAATLQGQPVLLAPLATRDPVESLDNLAELVSQETQVYLEIREKEVCQERREREDLQEMVSEDREARTDHQGHRESQERDPQVLLAPLGLVALQVVKVLQG